MLLAVQALALTVSPGPAHALTLITAKNVGLAVPWLLGAAYLARVIPTHYPVPLYVAEIGIGLIALAALPALATPGGRRLFVIIGVIPLSALVTTILTLRRRAVLCAEPGRATGRALPPAGRAGDPDLPGGQASTGTAGRCCRMSDTAALDCAALERRYRRLLAWFPAEHRRTYGEEMIGVLLASAPDGQDRPGPADVADLVSSGLRARLRSWSGVEKVDQKWADALAAYSVVAPILMTGFLSVQLYLAVQRLSLGRWARFPGEPSFTYQLIIVLLLEATAVAAVAGLAVGPVLIRRDKRLAVGLIAGAAVLIGLVATVTFDAGSPQFGPDQVGFTAFFLAELIAVAISPDPGRGWRVLAARGLITVMAVTVAMITIEFALQSSALSSVRIDRTGLELAAAALGIALIGVFASDAHKRMLILLLIPGYPLLIYVQLYSVMFVYNRNAVVQVLYLPTVTIAALVALAIWQASRRLHNA